MTSKMQLKQEEMLYVNCKTELELVGSSALVLR